MLGLELVDVVTFIWLELAGTELTGVVVGFGLVAGVVVGVVGGLGVVVVPGTGVVVTSGGPSVSDGSGTSDGSGVPDETGGGNGTDGVEVGPGDPELGSGVSSGSSGKSKLARLQRTHISGGGDLRRTFKATASPNLLSNN